MSDDFRRSIRELWTALRLPAPEFDNGSRVELEIDDVAIILRDSDDGEHLSVSGIAGRLSRSRRREADQIEALLRSNLGHLALAKPCVRLRQVGGGTHEVEVAALHPYGARNVAALTALIADVVARIELHGALLDDEPVGIEVGTRTLEMSQSETMIFRP
jgi:Tir chaperone protein (CesT) family